jgi:hypothetical protein
LVPNVKAVSENHSKFEAIGLCACPTKDSASVKKFTAVNVAQVEGKMIGGTNASSEFVTMVDSL